MKKEKPKTKKIETRKAKEIRLYKFMQTHVLGNTYKKDDLLSIPIFSPK